MNNTNGNQGTQKTFKEIRYEIKGQGTSLPD